MRAVLLSLVLLAAFVGPSTSASLVEQNAVNSACAPPCGPIPVIITITLDKSRNVAFDENGKFEASGKVQYYWDIDDNGYAWDPDPTKEVWVQMKVAKAPNWTKTKLEPEKFRVPIRPAEQAAMGCLDCVKPEGDPPAMQYVYEHPLKVTIEQTRDFTAEELKRWLKSDGTWRVTINAVSNDSFAGNEQVGKPAGLQEGYGVKEVRFTAPKGLTAQQGADGKGGAAPGLELFGFIAALGAGLALLRRRE